VTAQDVAALAVCAAAALWLKARQTCKDAHPRRINLVAAALKIGLTPSGLSAKPGRPFASAPTSLTKAAMAEFWDARPVSAWVPRG